MLPILYSHQTYSANQQLSLLTQIISYVFHLDSQPVLGSGAEYPTPTDGQIARDFAIAGGSRQETG